MAIIFSEDLTRDQGKLAGANLITGAWRTVGTKSDLNALTGSVSDRQTIEDGQLFWAKDEDKFYRYKVVQVGFSQTLSFEEFSFGGGSTPDGTISGSQQISDLGFLSSADTSSFVLVSETSSMSVATASFISDSFISASAARSGFGSGGGSIPSGTISSSQQITDFGFISSSVDISALNTFTGSIETEVDSLTNATSSYLTANSTGSFITSDVTSSMSVATASYALYAVSASHEIVTELSSSHAIQADSASYVDPTFISASAAASGFGAGSGVSSLQDVTDNGSTTTNALTINNDTLGATSLHVDGNHQYPLKITSDSLTGDPYMELGGDGIQLVDPVNEDLKIRIGPSNDITLVARFEYDPNSSNRNFAMQGTGSMSGFNVVAENSLTIGNLDNANTDTDKFLVIDGAGTVKYRSGVELLSDIGATSANDLSALNIFTSSIQTEVDSLTNATSSYLTSLPSGTISGSQQISELGFISSLPSGTISGSAQVEAIIDNTYISASAAASGFGTSEAVDITPLNTFSGSIQTQVDDLIAATGSYLDDTNTILVTQSEPSAVAGGVYFDGNDFYLGL